MLSILIDDTYFMLISLATLALSSVNVIAQMTRPYLTDKQNDSKRC